MCVAGSAWADGTLRVRADQWMPYNGDPAKPTPGYVVELARKIFGAQGITVDYQTMPWAEALKAAGAGEIEAVIGANPTEAKGLVLPDEAIGLPRIGLFVRKANPWKFSNVQLLREVRLGVIDGYSYWDSLDEYAKKHTGPEVVWFKGETPLKDALAKLDGAEIDVMAETLAVWVWTVKESGRSPADYRMAYLHQAEPIYLAFAAQGEAGRKYAKIWDAGIKELRKNGTLAAILEKYSVSDWK
ncbi:MAG: transporter substrate-binding domain-containing protein [Verrucomicrobia bacterium]|nr:transporter substrate-binding domain-containing protein [Verrucomicrobiota bacterium]